MFIYQNKGGRFPIRAHDFLNHGHLARFKYELPPEEQASNPWEQLVTSCNAHATVALMGTSCLQIVLFCSQLNPRMWVSWIPCAHCNSTWYFKVVFMNDSHRDSQAWHCILGSRSLSVMGPILGIVGYWPAFLVPSYSILVVPLILS